MPNNVELHLDKDNLASDIACKFVSWDNSKQQWHQEYMETLQYLYATDTKQIMTQKNDFNNCTHVPKLTQIADTLRTYYLESVFSLRDPIVFENYLSSAEEVEKKRNIQRFSNRILMERTNLKPATKELLDDYINAGNCFVMPIWETDTVTLADGSKGERNVGVRYMRINPEDIVFDVTARSFKDSPKIIRSVLSVADVATMSEDNPTMQKAFRRAMDNRSNVRRVATSGDTIVDNMCSIAGFGTWTDYFNSDCVEILTFFGDIFDIETNTLHKARKITVMDRCIVLANEDMPKYNKYDCIFQARWRDRVDNLWGMSPLSNLLGMQYRIDFLENKRADVYDFISDPMIKTKGDVSLPEIVGPGAEFNCPPDGDAAFMTPDATILTADTYIDRYMAMMDVMAGTPSEAIGFRTPGEKTMFEVQQLQNAASRVFTRQIRKFEEEIFEPMLNCSMQLYAENMKGQTITIEEEDESGLPEEIKISIDDLVRPGYLKVIGSINYADKAIMLQTLQQLGNSNIFMDEAVRANFSPSKIGYAIAYATGLDKIKGLYEKDARLYEVTDQQKLSERLMQQVDEVRADSIIEQQNPARAATGAAQAGQEELEELESAEVEYGSSED